MRHVLYDVVIMNNFLWPTERSRRLFDTYIHAYDTCLNEMKSEGGRWYNINDKVSEDSPIYDVPVVLRRWYKECSHITIEIQKRYIRNWREL